MFASTETAPPPPVTRAAFSSRRLLAVVLCLTATWVASALADRRQPDVLVRPLENINPTIGGWTVAEQQAWPASVINVLRPTAYLSRTYQKGNRQIALFVAYYSETAAGETMHSPKVCLPGNGWEIVSQGNTRIRLDGQDLTLNQYQVQNSGKHLLVFYWYQSRNRVIADEYLGKLLLIKDALTGGYTSGSLVRILLPDDAPAVQEGAEFARGIIPEVQSCLGTRRSR